MMFVRSLSGIVENIVSNSLSIIVLADSNAFVPLVVIAIMCFRLFVLSSVRERNPSSTRVLMCRETVASVKWSRSAMSD